MPRKPYSAREFEAAKRRAGQVLEQARRLARSGRYTDWASVLTELEPVEGYATVRRRFEEAAFRAQLNQLCALAQARTALQGHHPA